MKKSPLTFLKKAIRTGTVTVASLLLISSCDSGIKSEENHLEDQIWSSNEVLKYRIPVQSSGTKELSLDLQHIHGYNIKDLNVQFVMTSPSGQEILNKNYNLKFKNDDGSYVSDCSGDYCDLHQVLEPGINLTETGDYSVVISQNSGYDRVAGFLQLKLNLK